MISKTFNKIHFDDLSPTRFEDMCVNVVYRMRRWNRIQHFGRKGKDRGVDIYAEIIEEGASERWFIQCKRYQQIARSQLEAIVDEVVKTNKVLPEKYVLVLACDVTRDTFEEFQKYAYNKGIPHADIITASILEATLYANHPDLLYLFFGVNINNPRVGTVANIKRRLAMKRKIEEAFRGVKLGQKVLIRDVHRDVYPEQDFSIVGIYPWFRLEYLRTYHRGVSFVTGIESILVNENGGWKLSIYNEQVPAGWIQINAFVIGNIPYDNIVEIDISGDEHYRYPHFYCEFNNLGQPYEEIWYEPTDDYKSQVFVLDRDQRILNSEDTER